MNKLFCFLSLIMLLSLPALPVSAQGDTPPTPSGVKVVGFLFNRTTSEPGPEGVELMLHAWDEAGADRGMVHSLSGPGGKFEIADVAVEPGLFYVVMAIYQGTSYLSEPAVADEAGELPEFEVLLYETTTDKGEISIDLLHLVLGSGQGGLTVGEYYALSNHGDRTVAHAVELEDGTWATMQFSLPVGAASVTFPSSPDRFRLVGGGFADTRPLVPGVGVSQIIVSYVLQYEDDLVLKRVFPFNTEQISVFLPQRLGVQLEVKGAEDHGVEMLGSIPEAYEVYQLGPLRQGEVLELWFLGEMASRAQTIEDANAAPQSRTTAPEQAMIGMGVLGAAMILGGAWWMWRLKSVEEEEPLEHDPGSEYLS